MKVLTKRFLLVGLVLAFAFGLSIVACGSIFDDNRDTDDDGMPCNVEIISPKDGDQVHLYSGKNEEDVISIDCYVEGSLKEAVLYLNGGFHNYCHSDESSVYCLLYPEDMEYGANSVCVRIDCLSNKKTDEDCITLFLEGDDDDDGEAYYSWNEWLKKPLDD